jgi:hypothetical protein
VNLVSVRGATSAVRGPIYQAAQGARRRVAERESRWLVPFGRAGFAANGVVYVIVGVLAAQAALGRGGDTTDLGGALGHLLEAPLGRVAVAAVGFGLAGYAAWRLLQALLDSEHKGTRLAGLVQRVGFGISALSYAALAAAALGMALQRAAQPNGSLEACIDTWDAWRTRVSCFPGTTTSRWQRGQLQYRRGALGRSSTPHGQAYLGRSMCLGCIVTSQTGTSVPASLPFWIWWHDTHSLPVAAADVLGYDVRWVRRRRGELAAGD